MSSSDTSEEEEEEEVFFAVMVFIGAGLCLVWAAHDIYLFLVINSWRMFSNVVEGRTGQVQNVSNLYSHYDMSIKTNAALCGQNSEITGG